MPSKILSVAFNGLEARLIEVESEVSFGLRCFSIVGLADKSVDESKERVAIAIKNSGFNSPYSKPERVLINLAPADLKKEGSLYDLPIALGYLLSSKQISFSTDKKIFAGELSLDGQIKPIKNCLSLALFAKENKYKEIIIPKQNENEAFLSLKNQENSDFKITGVESLSQAINYLENKIKIISDIKNINSFSTTTDYPVDFGWIKGQETSKRALLISASGGHNILMQGPPGAGKSLLAQAMPSILPRLSFDEIIELTKIYSASGLLDKNNPIVNFRPFRSPHHTASETALIGGGTPLKAGEITLAHRGILFLDEFPEFHRDVLESLRQPLEEGKISILRARERAVFPARFTLIAAANPCPCGNYRNPLKSCACQLSQVFKYRRKLTGPLMDRIDIFTEVPQLKFEKLDNEDINNNSSQKIKEKVEIARDIQKQRFLKDNINLSINSEMQAPHIKKYCRIDSKSKNLLRSFVDSGKLSGRGYHKILKIGKTIADLEQSEEIKYSHIAEALMYRAREE